MPDPYKATPAHDYTSTACGHDIHTSCRLACKFWRGPVRLLVPPLRAARWHLRSDRTLVGARGWSTSTTSARSTEDR